MLKVLDFLASKPPKEWRYAVISGEEEFLRQEAVEHLLQALNPDVEVVARGSEQSMDLRDLLDDLCMQSLFGGERVFVISEADAFVKEHADVLERFVRQDGACHPLILSGANLVPKGRKPGGKTGLIGAVEVQRGVLVSCGVLYDAPFQGRGAPWQSPLSRWVASRAGRYGKSMTMEVGYYLHQQVGNKLRELDGELRKLATFVGQRPAILTDDIDACILSKRTVGTFQLAELLADGDMRLVLEHLDVLFERGMNDGGGRHLSDPHTLAIMLLSAVSNRLRKLGQAHELMDAGSTFEQAAAAVKQPGFAYDRFRKQLEAWRSARHVVVAMESLLALDAQLKSGGGDPRALVSLCFVGMMPPRGRKRGA
jgi:DNA polymerase III delta subunit